MKITVIVNPAAGGKRRATAGEAFRSALGRRGHDVSVHVTAGPGHARRLACDLAPEADLVCAVGGDGTVHEVANGILPRRVPLAVVPMGSGNDLASLVDCPRTPEDLARAVEEGWTAQLDVIDFGDRFCVNSAGIGFEGSVNRLSHGLARVGGRARYALALARALGSVSCPDLTILTSRGDEIRGRKLMVSIGNGHRTGGAFYLTPGAYPDDGLADVCIIEPMSRTKMLRVLPRALNGTHVRRREVSTLRVEALSIEATAAYPMHIDGEYVLARPERREIAVRPAALTVLCRRSGRNKLVRELVRAGW